MLYHFSGDLDLFAGQIAQAVVGGILIEVVQAGVVEDGGDHIVEGFTFFHERRRLDCRQKVLWLGAWLPIVPEGSRTPGGEHWTWSGRRPRCESRS